MAVSLSLACEVLAKEPEPANLHFIGGEFVSGCLIDSLEPDTLTWQSSSFATPFQFNARELQRIQFLRSAATPDVRQTAVTSDIGQYRFEIEGGDVLLGSIVQLQDSLAVLNITDLGIVHLEMSAVRRLQRWTNPEGLQFHGPGRLNEWQADRDWRAEGAHLVCDRSTRVGSPEMEDTGVRGRTSGLSMLRRDIALPPRGRLEFRVSWNLSPDFEFRIGTGEGTSAARFTFWENFLVMLRAAEPQHDAITVQAIPFGPGSIQLQVYFDQELGLFQVYSSSGRLLGELSIPEKSPRSRHLVEFACQLSDVRIERLDVGHWSGEQLRDVDDLARVLLSDGSLVYGRQIGFDVTTREFIISDPATQRRVAEGLVQDVTIPRSYAPQLEVLQAETISGLRVSGKLRRVEEKKIWLQSEVIREQIALSIDSLRSLAAKGEERVVPERGRRLVYPLSRLEIPGLSLLGQLQETEAPDERRLAWKPERSRTASLLLPSVTGRLVYREPTPQDIGTPKSPRPPRSRTGPVGAKADVSSSPLTRPILHLVSGDQLSCRGILMNDRGLTILSTATDSTFVTSDAVRRIDLVSGLPGQPAGLKMDRFLVLPRSQRNDPPLHLLHSVDGDLLRGRILSMDQTEIEVELRSATHKLKRDHVGRIEFLHKSGTAIDPAMEPAGGIPVRALLNGDQRLSFAAMQVTGIFLLGHSPALGDCRIDLQQLQELRFGPGSMTSEPVADPWDFRLAIEPAGIDGNDEATDLVGTVAPDFVLDQLDGGRFKLSDHRGKILVLDFWASWCAPCLQLMPQIDKVVHEFPDQDLDLISVNLEERPEQVRGVLDRLKLTTTVVLDTAGRTAARYRATTIPLTVVVGRDGKIARLFVGSGPRFGDQLREALKTLLAEQPKAERPE